MEASLSKAFVDVAVSLDHLLSNMTVTLYECHFGSARWNV